MKYDFAFPHKDLEYDGGDQYRIIRNGLTKREYFAAMAMQGLIMRDAVISDKSAATKAVSFADAMIKELNKEQ